MKKLKKLLLIIPFFGLFSCEKAPENICILPSQEIQSNSPVVLGGQLNLNVVDNNANVFEPTTYFWTGPNGFTSNLKNPIIQNSSSLMSGEYNLIKKIGLCESVKSSIAVSIIANPITCSISQNNYKVNNSNVNIISVARSGNEFICYDNNNGQLIVRFDPNILITSGLYKTVQYLGSGDNSRDIEITLPYSRATSGGDVLVSVANNMVTVKFCSLNFNSNSTNSTFIVSGHIQK